MPLVMVEMMLSFRFSGCVASTYLSSSSLRFTSLPCRRSISYFDSTKNRLRQPSSEVLGSRSGNLGSFRNRRM